MSMRIHRELDRWNTNHGKRPSKFTLKMPIKRYIFVIFLTVSYLINTVLVSFEDLGFFFSLLRRMQETLQLWTVFGRLQSLKNFRLSVNWRFSSLKKRQLVPYIVPWPQENEKYNKLKKRNSEIRPWAFLRNRSWLSSHPAWSKSTSTGMDRGKIN